MVRSAVLVSNALVKLQLERIAKESGIHEWERYFSVEEPDFQAEPDVQQLLPEVDSNEWA